MRNVRAIDDVSLPFLIKSKFTNCLQLGTCAHLRAARMQNIVKFKNAAVSGVVGVQCARHGFYMPRGTVDLTKGEAYVFVSILGVINQGYI